MNKLKGIIIAIESAETVSLVDLEVGGWKFSCIVLETPETTAYLQTGNEVFLLFKESTVGLGRDISGTLSLRNRVKVRVSGIDRGKILSRVSMEFEGKCVTSLITTRSATALAIQAGDAIEMFIKASDITLMEADGE